MSGVGGGWIMNSVGMRTRLMRAKVNLVGTPAGNAYERLRWAAMSVKRYRHPELWDFYLEPYRFDLALTHLISDDDHCFDGGCHVGSILAQMVRLAPRGRHTAVEPVPHKVAALSRRFPQVNIVAGALGAERGSMTFFDHHSGFASFHPDPLNTDASAGREVEVHTIDDIVGDTRLDLLKLDIEGAELWALQGGRKVVEYNEPTILIECGRNGVLEPFGYTRADMHHFLVDELDYAIYSVVDFLYGRNPLSRHEFDRAGIYPFRGFNYICVPSSRRVQRVIAEGARERLF
jgi:FkbM family methyltransferase